MARFIAEILTIIVAMTGGGKSTIALGEPLPAQSLYFSYSPNDPGHYEPPEGRICDQCESLEQYKYNSYECHVDGESFLFPLFYSEISVSDITSYSINIFGSFYTTQTPQISYDDNTSSSEEYDESESESESDSDSYTDERNMLSVNLFGIEIGSVQVPKYEDNSENPCLNCCRHLNINKTVVFPEIRPQYNSIRITPVNTDAGYVCISHVKISFTYRTTFPTLTKVYPQLAPLEGGTKVIIKGEDFRNNMNLFCFFNNEKRTALYLDNEHVMCVVPPLPKEEFERRRWTEADPGLIKSPLSVVFADQSDYTKANLSMVLSNGLAISYYRQPTILRVVPAEMYTKGFGMVSVVAANMINTDTVKCKFQSRNDPTNAKVTRATLDDNLVMCEVPSWDAPELVNLSITLNGQQYNEPVIFEFTNRNALVYKLLGTAKYALTALLGCCVVALIITGFAMVRKRNRLVSPSTPQLQSSPSSVTSDGTSSSSPKKVVVASPPDESTFLLESKPPRMSKKMMMMMKGKVASPPSPGSAGLMPSSFPMSARLAAMEADGMAGPSEVMTQSESCINNSSDPQIRVKRTKKANNNTNNNSNISKEERKRERSERRPVLMFNGSEVEFVKKVVEETLPVAYDVFVGKWKGSFVTVKLLRPNTVCEESLILFENEISVLRCSRSPAIIEYFGNVYNRYSGTYAILTEHMDLGNLHDVLHGTAAAAGPLDIEWPTLLRMLRDIAAAVSYLHASGYVLLNMSPRHFLVNKNLQVKFCALSSLHDCKDDEDKKRRRRRRDPFEKCVSLNLWCSPEVLAGENPQTVSLAMAMASDAYSFAMIMWEFVTRQLPFFGAALEEVVDRVIGDGLRPEIPAWCPWRYAEFVEACWDPTPEARPSFPEIAKGLSALGCLGWMGVPGDCGMCGDSCSSSAESSAVASPGDSPMSSPSSSVASLPVVAMADKRETKILVGGEGRRRRNGYEQIVSDSAEQSPPPQALSQQMPRKQLDSTSSFSSSSSSSSSSFKFSSDEYL